jgi:metallo-beta-lactamase class B
MIRHNKRPQLTALLTISLLFAGFYSTAQKLIPPPIFQENWLQDCEPFRIAGNLYYVGTYDLACYLITTPKGHILINTGLAESETMIRSHVEALGFKFSDIRILLATHTHYDHVGAMAAIKKMTHAKLMVNKKDAPVLTDGGNSDYIFGGKGSTFQPVKVNRLLHDHDIIKLGGMQIVLLHHPGHSKGASTFVFDIRDESRSYHVAIVNMPTIPDGVKPIMDGYPDLIKDYAYTFDALKKLQFDIWFSSHASQFGLHKKRKPGDAYHPEAFIDRQKYDSLIADLYRKYLERFGSN